VAGEDGAVNVGGFVDDLFPWPYFYKGAYHEAGKDTDCGLVVFIEQPCKEVRKGDNSQDCSYCKGCKDGNVKVGYGLHYKGIFTH